MSTFFDVVGPFEIHRDEGLCLSGQSKLWKAADEHEVGLAKAIGCYLFCLQRGKKLTPWYVGMTVAKAGFRGEVFQKHKIDIYNEVLNGTSSEKTPRKGKPVLFLFPLWTSSNRFSKAYASSFKTIQWLERTLMGMAYAQNVDLSNVRDMTALKTIEVSGLLGPRRAGRPYNVELDIRRALLGPAA